MKEFTHILGYSDEDLALYCANHTDSLYYKVAKALYLDNCMKDAIELLSDAGVSPEGAAQLFTRFLSMEWCFILTIFGRNAMLDTGLMYQRLRQLSHVHVAYRENWERGVNHDSDNGG